MKAFPTVFMDYIPKEEHQGMDLRDYFAAKALAGMSANPNDDHNPYQEEYEEYAKNIAESAYQLADAMMEARK